MGKDNGSGAWGENRAAEYLQSRGYVLLERNYRLRGSEVDIIAKKDGYLAFVEVKTRKSSSYGSAAEFVGAAKQQRLLRAAGVYLASHPTELQPRFDVIEIYAPRGTETQRPTIRHIPDAFGLSGY